MRHHQMKLLFSTGNVKGEKPCKIRRFRHVSLDMKVKYWYNNYIENNKKSIG